MKKLLSLLSVLTISGSAVPTTITDSPYQKEENIKNIDINYQQTNNSKNLNRVKRQSVFLPKDVSPKYRYNETKAIKVDIVSQTTNLSCNPAVALSLLSSWSFRKISQERMIRLMGTTNNCLIFWGGTSPLNWTNTINGCKL